MRVATEITAELIASGMDQRQTALVMELVLVLSGGNSARTLVESPEQLRLEKRKAWDRERKRLKKLSANSTGIPLESTGIPAETAERPCNLLKEKSGLQEEVLKKKESKKGTRISSDFALTAEDIQFALDCGIPQESIKDELAEFVDYWIAIPGSRGTKLNWHSTWRNRVRQIAPKYRSRNLAKPLTEFQRKQAEANDYGTKLRAVADSLGGSGSTHRVLPDYRGQQSRDLPDGIGASVLRLSRTPDRGGG